MASELAGRADPDERIETGGQRELDRYAGAAALGRGQQIEPRQDRLRGRVGAAAEWSAARPDSQLASPGPIRPTLSTKTLHHARPRTMLQLVPPKPKELLMIRAGLSLRLSSR